jgi:hypothetical protein
MPHTWSWLPETSTDVCKIFSLFSYHCTKWAVFLFKSKILWCVGDPGLDMGWCKHLAHCLLEPSQLPNKLGFISIVSVATVPGYGWWGTGEGEAATKTAPSGRGEETEWIQYSRNSVPGLQYNGRYSLKDKMRLIWSKGRVPFRSKE